MSKPDVSIENISFKVRIDLTNAIGTGRAVQASTAALLA